MAKREALKWVYNIDPSKLSKDDQAAYTAWSTQDEAAKVLKRKFQASVAKSRNLPVTHVIVAMRKYGALALAIAKAPKADGDKSGDIDTLQIA